MIRYGFRDLVSPFVKKSFGRRRPVDELFNLGPVQFAAGYETHQAMGGAKFQGESHFGLQFPKTKAVQHRSFVSGQEQLDLSRHDGAWVSAHEAAPVTYNCVCGCANEGKLRPART